jgi:hypothetical protein
MALCWVLLSPFVENGLRQLLEVALNRVKAGIGAPAETGGFGARTGYWVFDGRRAVGRIVDKAPRGQRGGEGAPLSSRALG